MYLTQMLSVTDEMDILEHRHIELHGLIWADSHTNTFDPGHLPSTGTLCFAFAIEARSLLLNEGNLLRPTASH